MSYQVSRGGQMYGPYSMDELQRYLASGNILPTDMVKGEALADWAPLSTLVPSAPPPVIPPSGFGAQAYGAQPATPQMGPGSARFESVPNLHWGWLFVLLIVTVGIFTIVWDLILASWSKKIGGTSQVPIWYYASAGIVALQLIAMVASGSSSGAYAFVALMGFIVQVITRFKMRTLLEEHYTTVEPVGLTLSGVMTFFFGEIYFQYHLNRINRYKEQRAFAI